MNTTKVIGIVLIGISFFVCNMGFNKISENSAQVKILNIKIDASNESGKEEGYIYLGIAALLFRTEVCLVTKNKNLLFLKGFIELIKNIIIEYDGQLL